MFDAYIDPRLPRRGRLLDVGSGIGTFVQVAKNRGWHAEGVELNAESVRIARERFGLSLHWGSFYELERVVVGLFDVISMHHVYEHVLHPGSFLEYLKKFLVEDGAVLVSVPNILSDDFLRKGASWEYIHIPGHISYFSPHSLLRVFSLMGFKQEFITSFPAPGQSEGEGLVGLYRFAGCDHSEGKL